METTGVLIVYIKPNGQRAILGLIARQKKARIFKWHSAWSIAQSDFAQMKEVSVFFTLCAMRLALCRSGGASLQLFALFDV